MKKPRRSANKRKSNSLRRGLAPLFVCLARFFFFSSAIAQVPNAPAVAMRLSFAALLAVSLGESQPPLVKSFRLEERQRGRAVFFFFFQFRRRHVSLCDLPSFSLSSPPSPFSSRSLFYFIIHQQTVSCGAHARQLTYQQCGLCR